MPGVKDLLARFEQKSESDGSPPDRGRSPGPASLSIGNTPTPSASPRPLSKVRTSFVAVQEKDGRIGLRREPSGDSVSVSSRRLSTDTDVTTPAPLSDKKDIFADSMARASVGYKTSLAEEAIPESPKHDGSPSKTSPGKLSRQTTRLDPNPNPDKVTDEEERKTRLLRGNPTDKASLSSNGITESGFNKSLNTPPNASEKPKQTNGTKPVSGTKPVLANTPVKAPLRSAKNPDISIKSPLRATHTQAEKKPTVSTSKARKQEATQGAADRATVTEGKAASRNRTKPSAISLPPPSTGFVKPKPKSPTRPLRLPASLTTHTASSASKFDNDNSTTAPPRSSTSRASANAQHLRPTSRASISTAGSRNLRRQSSSIGRARPSLGPPPKKAAEDHPVVKKDHEVDEGFLARMMRPTQSSSSKTNEKLATPPRKPSAPLLSKKSLEDNGTKSVAAKIQQSVNVKPGPKAHSADRIAVAPSPTAKESAPFVTPAEPTNEAIGTADVLKNNLAPSLVEETSKLGPVEEPAVSGEELPVPGDVEDGAAEELPESFAVEPQTAVDATSLGNVDSSNDAVLDANTDPAREPVQLVDEKLPASDHTGSTPQKYTEIEVQESAEPDTATHSEADVPTAAQLGEDADNAAEV